MNAGDLLFWLALLGGVAFAIGMLWLATWAMFGDRPRGKLRCPKCWYDLSYSFSLTCSECGHTVGHAAQLMRRRRRWSVALAAVASLTAAGLFVIDRANQRGWAAMAPSRLLLMALPFNDGAGNGSVIRELLTRQQRGLLSDAERASVVDRCVAGDWWARPPSDAWADKYGLIIRAWRDTVLSDSPLRDKLLKLPAKVELTTRDAWPEGEPVVFQLRLQEWWPARTQCRVRLTLQHASAPAMVLNHGEARLFSSVAVSLPSLTWTGDAIVIDAEVEQRRGTEEIDAAGKAGGEPRTDSGGGWLPAGAQRFTLRPRLLAQTDPPPLTPVSGDAELDDLMRQVFRGHVSIWSEGRSPVRFRYDPGRTFSPLCDHMAIGAVVEVMRDDGAVARRLRLWWRAGSGPRDRERAFGWEIPEENPELLAQVNSSDGRWFMRVRGDHSLALRVGAGSSFWSGEFTMPLIVQDLNGEAPEPAWWIEQQ